MFEIEIAFSSYSAQLIHAAFFGKLEEVKGLADVVDVNYTDWVSAEPNTSGKISKKANCLCSCIHVLRQNKGRSKPILDDKIKRQSTYSV